MLLSKQSEVSQSCRNGLQNGLQAETATAAKTLESKDQSSQRSLLARAPVNPSLAATGSLSRFQNRTKPVTAEQKNSRSRFSPRACPWHIRVLPAYLCAASSRASKKSCSFLHRSCQKAKQKLLLHTNLPPQHPRPSRAKEKRATATHKTSGQRCSSSARRGKSPPPSPRS